MTNMIGRRLGRYEIRAELGRGGMARVYRAVDTQLQRPVAMKVLAAQLSMDPEFVQRFEREARTAASLRHPSIVTIYDVGEQDGLHFIAMEFINGRTLHSILHEQSALGLGYAISLLDPVARALDFAHTQGAVHRDVKPHNMMVDVGGRVVLTDFGIAQTPEADGERLTRTGVFMGTPEYISPEQAEARRVDGRSDLYSLGVVAYEIITGRVPFSGATPQLIVSHAQLPPPPPSSVLAHLPGEIDLVLTRALAKRPESRYPSGAELVAALREVARRYGTPLASREQLAALVAGPLTDSPTTPTSLPPPPQRAPERASPEPAHIPQPQMAAAAPPPARPSVPRQPEARPQPAAEPPRPATRPPARARTPRGGAGNNPLAVLLIGGALVILTLLLLFAVARGLANSGAPTPAPTAGGPSPTLAIPPSATAPPPSATAPPPSATAPPPSATPAAASPTVAPPPSPLPPSPLPPTRAPAPPTAAPVASATPAPSDIPAPSDTPPPSATAPPPSDTPTLSPTVSPSATASLTPEPALTPIFSSPTVITPIYPSP